MQNMQIRKKQSKLVQISLLRVDIQMKVIRQICCPDKEASVYLGNGVALPHGLASSKETIKNSGICFVQVPDGVDFNGEKAYLLVGVAGKGEEHVELLGKIGQTLMDEGVIEKLKNSTSKEEVINLLNL